MIEADLLIGKEIEGYRFINRLGRGSYGTVYSAVQVNTGKNVAVKFITMDDPNANREVRNQIDILAGMERHVNVVQLINAHTHGNHQLIVMELVKGGTLAHLLRNLPQGRLLDHGTVLRGIEGLADVLALIHQRRILHLDLKPENILIERDNDGIRFVLTDFGISQFFSKGKSVSSAVGSPNYMSPEQFGFNDRRVDHRTDIYALGVILYELLTGHLPFRAHSLRELALAHRTIKPAPPPPQYGVHPTLVDVMLRSLEKEPNERHPSAEVLRDIIRELRRDPAAQIQRTHFAERFAISDIIVRTESAFGSRLGPMPPIKQPVGFTLQLQEPGADKTVERTVQVDQITIGRSNTADIQVQHPSLSRLHTRLRWIRSSNEVHIMDMDSLNGTFIKGARLQPKRWARLREDHEVKIGDAILKMTGIQYTEDALESAFAVEAVEAFLDEVQQLNQQPDVDMRVLPDVLYLESGEARWVKVYVKPKNTPPAAYTLRISAHGHQLNWVHENQGSRDLKSNEEGVFDLRLIPPPGTVGGRSYDLALEIEADNIAIPQVLSVLHIEVSKQLNFDLTLHPDEVLYSRWRKTSPVLTIMNFGNYTETFEIHTESTNQLKVIPEVNIQTISPHGGTATVRLDCRPQRRAPYMIYSTKVIPTSGGAKAVRGVVRVSRLNFSGITGILRDVFSLILLLGFITGLTLFALEIRSPDQSDVGYARELWEMISGFFRGL